MRISLNDEVKTSFGSQDAAGGRNTAPIRNRRLPAHFCWQQQRVGPFMSSLTPTSLTVRATAASSTSMWLAQPSGPHRVYFIAGLNGSRGWKFGLNAGYDSRTMNMNETPLWTRYLAGCFCRNRAITGCSGGTRAVSEPTPHAIEEGPWLDAVKDKMREASLSVFLLNRCIWTGFLSSILLLNYPVGYYAFIRLIAEFQIELKSISV